MFKKVLIANRGEIAVRIARAIADCGAVSVAVHGSDDGNSLHVARADEACQLPGSGAAAYLDIGSLIEAARRTGSDAIHPGYGFLSESAEFASACRAAGIAFIGPSSEALALFGNKAASRELARSCGVPILDGTTGPTTVEQAVAFFERLPQGSSAIIKAIAGGGGRGMRIVRSASDVAAMHEICRREALQAFGSGDVYIEALMENARHIEIQILCDMHGGIVHFGERECTLQRRGQKLVEISPSPSLHADVRRRLVDHATALARRSGYCGLGTFEFLVRRAESSEAQIAFIECNPRLQVEHTVTEEVCRVDLVSSQIAVAAGASLQSLGVSQGDFPPARRCTMQLRVNLERLTADGTVRPTSGTIETFEPPFGPGIRVDTFAYAGYATSTQFDSLLAKVCVSAASYPSLLNAAYRALCQFRVSGVQTNIAFLQALITHPDVAADKLHTRFVDEQMPVLARTREHDRRYFEPTPALQRESAARADDTPAGTLPLVAPMQGQIVALHFGPGDRVQSGQIVAELESMKMQHAVRSTVSGMVLSRLPAVGDVVMEAQPLFYVVPDGEQTGVVAEDDRIDPEVVPPAVAQLLQARVERLDGSRGEAVSKRTARGLRSPRTNIADLVDPDSFMELGSFLAAVDGNPNSSPGDGAITGLATVNGALFGARQAEVAVVAFDTTVLAGTMGTAGRQKMERMFRLAEQRRIPLVLFAEGGGARSGEEAGPRSLKTFCAFASLNGKVPTVGIVSGPCFAANAALVGCCDVVIATRRASIGMAGPAMIEGGGLGVVRPEDVGPASVQSANGVIDILVEDEAAAVAAAKRYLGFFQGIRENFECADQRILRHIVPENRKRAYDMRVLIEGLVDTDTFLELRAGFGRSLITGFAHVEGRPIGICASNPQHLGGAIDSDASDKAARFMQLCDAFGIPILTLIDTPGFMVGPEAERTALVRHTSRLMVIAAHISVPYVSLIVRKCYGLGGLGMNGGDHQRPLVLAAWPTAEHGPMNVEGSVRLGLKRRMAEISDPQEQQRLFDEAVAKLYERGSALSTARRGAIDELIDPAESRAVIVRALRSTDFRGAQGRGSLIDAW